MAGRPSRLATRALRALGQSVWLVDQAALALASALLILMAALNGLEAISRIFGSSSIYYVQISLVLGSFVYFVGYLVLLRRSEDVSVAFFHKLLPPTARKVIDVLTALAIVVFFAVLLYASIGYYGLTSLMRHPVLPVQQSATTIPIIIGAGGCLLVAIYRAAVALRDLFNGNADRP